MKGLLFILIIYILTFAFCIAAKLVLEKLKTKKGNANDSAPKIYYVTKQKKPRNQTSGVLPIKATVVEKENLEN